MKKTLLANAIGAVLIANGSAFAGSLEDRLAAMEKRMAYLEQRVASQDRVIEEKNAQIAELSGASTGGAGGWFQSVEIGGVVEVEVGHSDNGGANDTTDVAVPTVELGVAAQINDWIGAEVVALYEDDGTHSGQFDIDTAMVTIADPDNIWFVNAGQYVVPFGVYDTHMVSDPLTLEVGETGDAALEVGIQQHGMFASAYVFNGDQPHNDGAAWGVAAGYEGQASGFEFAGQLGYINDLAESDAIVDDGTRMTDEAGAWIASITISSGNFTFIGEYLAATDTLSGYGEEPSVFNLEAGMGFDMGGMPATFAIGYQGSDDAAATAGGLAEQRLLAALTVEVLDGTSIALEVAQEEDYAGVETNSVTGLLAVEF